MKKTVVSALDKRERLVGDSSAPENLHLLCCMVVAMLEIRKYVADWKMEAMKVSKHVIARPSAAMNHDQPRRVFEVVPERWRQYGLRRYTVALNACLCSVYLTPQIV